MRWLVLEPYHDGSHRALVDGLVERVVPEAVVWTLPARKWKWRMRGAALEFARRFAPARFATLAGLMIGVGSLGNVLGAAPLAADDNALYWSLARDGEPAGYLLGTG
mgnify:CR=1 FL=1